MVVGWEREASLKPYAWNFTPRAVLPQPYCLESSASCCLNCGPWIETKTLSHLPSAIHFGQCCFEPSTFNHPPWAVLHNLLNRVPLKRVLCPLNRVLLESPASRLASP